MLFHCVALDFTFANGTLSRNNRGAKSDQRKRRRIWEPTTGIGQACCLRYCPLHPFILDQSGNACSEGADVKFGGAILLEIQSETDNETLCTLIHHSLLALRIMTGRLVGHCDESLCTVIAEIVGSQGFKSRRCPSLYGCGLLRSIIVPGTVDLLWWLFNSMIKFVHIILLWPF